MGTNAVLDRFRQIEPKVLIACDGVHYGGRDFDRTARGGASCAPRCRACTHLIVHRNLGVGDGAHGALGAVRPTWRRPPRATTRRLAAFEPLWLPFDHPLWIVYSSGTTGLPKPIVHGHGGTVLVALALKRLHNDIGCSYEPNSWGERYHWYSSTGWVMWNAQVSGLLDGTTCCIYDGNPGGSKDKPGLERAVALRRRPGRHVLRRRRGLLRQLHEGRRRPRGTAATCARVRALGTTGSPLSGGRAALGHARSSSSIGTPRHLVVQHLRRHRLRRRLHRRQPRAAAGARRDAVPRCSAARSRPGTSRASR